MTSNIKIKEIEKSIDKSIRKLAKEYGYKFASYSMFKHYDKFFLYALCSASRVSDGDYICIQMYAKPYELDDIFWTIFDMEENIHESDSLRANGAFSAPSVKFDETCIRITNVDQLEDPCRNVIMEFTTRSDRFINSIGGDISGFFTYISRKPDVMDAILIKLLVLIQLGDYQSAYEIVSNEIDNCNSGGFENKGKDIYYYIRDYCLVKLGSN